MLLKIKIIISDYDFHYFRSAFFLIILQSWILKQNKVEYWFSFFLRTSRSDT